MSELPSTPEDSRGQGTLGTCIAILTVAGGSCLVVGAIQQEVGAALVGGLALIIAMLLGLFYAQLAPFRFTLWILIVNLAAMLKPGWFLELGGVSLTDPWLILILVQLIMFGMGTQMRMRDFANVVKMPTGVIVGILCQFAIMPLLGYTLAKSFGFPPDIGAGLVLIGSCSSGLSSNVMTYLAGGNLALSVTLTAIATAAAPIVTPLWMKYLAGSMVEVNAVQMSLNIVKIVLVPILAAFVHDFRDLPGRTVRRGADIAFVCGLAWLGFLLAGGWDTLTAGLSPTDHGSLLSLLSLPGYVAGAFVFGTLYHIATKRLPGIADWMPVISMFGIVYFTLATTAKGRDQLLEVGLLLLVAVMLHNLVGYVLGYNLSRLLAMNKQDARTIAIEVGCQNGAMAIGLAKTMGKLETAGLAAVIFAPLMNVTGSIIANRWRRKIPDDH